MAKLKKSLVKLEGTGTTDPAKSGMGATTEGTKVCAMGPVNAAPAGFLSVEVNTEFATVRGERLTVYDLKPWQGVVDESIVVIELDMIAVGVAGSCADETNWGVAGAGIGRLALRRNGGALVDARCPIGIQKGLLCRRRSGRHVRNRYRGDNRLQGNVMPECNTLGGWRVVQRRRDNSVLVNSIQNFLVKRITKIFVTGSLNSITPG